MTLFYLDKIYYQDYSVKNAGTPCNQTRELFLSRLSARTGVCLLQCDGTSFQQ
jgi:hypothetical protein